MSVREGLLRPALLTALLGASARAMAAFSGMLLAHTFGAHEATDAYLLARTIPIGLYLILDSVVYNTLVPALRRENNPASLFRHAFIGATILGALLSAGMTLGSAPLMEWLAASAADTTRSAAVSLQRLGAWAVFMAVPASCLKAWNATHDRYVAAALDGFLISGLLLATLLAMPADAGVVPITLALPGAFALLLAVQAWLGRDAWSSGSPATPWRTAGRWLRRPVPPLLALNLAQQAQTWLAVALAAGFGTGSVSQVHFSYGIAQIPVGIIDLVLFSTFFPFAAGLAARDDHTRLGAACAAAAQALMLLCVPLALWLIAARTTVVEAVLAHGLFHNEDAVWTAALLVGHAAAIPGWCLESLGCRTLFALNRHGYYLGVVILRLAVFMGLTRLILPAAGLPGISVAFAAAFTVSGLISMAVIRRELPIQIRPLNPEAVRFLGLLAVLSGAVIAATLGANKALVMTGVDQPFIRLMIQASLSAPVFAALGAILWKTPLPRA
jgi:putative peptidoglycan lipid II flippase